MTEITDKAVWRVCRDLYSGCDECPLKTTPRNGNPYTHSCHRIARETIEKSLAAVAEHPDLPPGWARGP
jgi:hypothetical protein